MTPEARDALRQLRDELDIALTGGYGPDSHWSICMAHAEWQAIREALDGGLPAQPAWQPIDTAPKDGTEILVSHGNGEFASVVWWEEVMSGWIVAALSDHSIYADAPTHWMPLPAPLALPAQREPETKDEDDQSRGGKWGSPQADLPRRNDGDE